MTTASPRDLAERIAQVVAAKDFGKANAHKRGRNPRFPYVPVIMHFEPKLNRWRQEQIVAWAFVTRKEAVAHAAEEIEQRRQQFAETLANPRYRALREEHGLPREIEGEWDDYSHMRARKEQQ